ncbi:flagellar hook-associated protein FlgK [Leptothrix discophora]|uniref:Flagellar hook-associated protein 1 n=1 Tax=Leptothrix discophora TaxID=89 RepID=A0ABT9FY25_LEPDI|nr:flagellar hook-associated protein FlgK [Leptothrix discophora]MDP4299144.1 flagellar hook-associated protein FlgK [Leptothrix discophora]
MSTTSLMNVGTRAMFAAQAQLQTTGHNISNANVAGYSRQETVLTTASGSYTGAGYFGRGVTVQTVTRAVDGFLTDRVAQTRSQASADSTRLDLLNRLEGSFGTGESGLGYAATQVFNAFSDVANSPADPSARQVVLARSEELASRFRASADQIESLQASTTLDVRNTVDTINGLARQIAKLNDNIAGAQGNGQSPNDLLDQRDQLIGELSQHVQVTRLEQDDGSLNLFIGGGQSLVLGNSAYQLTSQPDDFDPSRVRVGIQIGGIERRLDEGMLGGGTLTGLVRFQNQDLAHARDQLGLLAGTLAREVNRQQSFGLGLDGQPGNALFRYGDANAIPAKTNAVDGAGNLIGAISLTVTDSRALQPSEYELSVNPDGSYDVLRRSDGATFANLADGATLDGYTITGGGVPGDRFLLQPFSTAAQGLGVALADPRGIAAANPVNAVAAPANTGTGTISALTIEAPPAGSYSSFNVTFGAQNALGGRDYTLTDSGGGVLASGSWSAGTPIRHDGIAIKLDGVPASGDTFAIQPTLQASSSNGNALALEGLAHAAMAVGLTFTNQYAQALSGIGVRVQGAQAAADVSSAAADQAATELGARTGVNLDEEAARLMQYQQSYQAAAKVLQVAQKVFDTILSIAA